jgi:putative N6-adenine-specific DNA methylase
MVTNPPYGERISTPDLLGTYATIGERLKRAFVGNEAWILSYREECFDQIGLRPSIKIPVYNGSLECEFRKYTIFEGKLKEFRSEGGIVKTEEEKAAMAEKRRFKKNREFKQRLEEDASNEEGDIRTFTFHHHRLGSFRRDEENAGRKPEKERRFRDDDHGGKRRFRDGDRDGDRRSRGGGRSDNRRFRDSGWRKDGDDRQRRGRRENDRRNDNED